MRLFLINNMKKIGFLILLSTFYFLFSNSAMAASFYFESDQPAPAVGQVFKVSLMLDTQEQEINALEGQVVFSDNLEPLEILEGETMVVFWLDKPHLENSQVVFSGIVPGGYRGFLMPYSQDYHPAKVLEIMVEAKEPGQGQISLAAGRVLLNDGLGTSTELTTQPLRLEILPILLSPKKVYPKDIIPPEPFKALVSNDPAIFENQYFLAFAAQDKDTGVDYYQVKESRFKNPWFRGWKIAESPYLLHDQKLTSYIFVKAVDKAGNERVAVITPQNPYKWYQDVWFYVIIMSVIFIIFLIKQKKRRATQ